ncbi:GNAT family N-acetyltransferase [Emticicia sp. C21]|uniref:GNAT family N-acetyltransferase n=1 Tax=Emticicia sp. C21 TaxID=2302915 RepID=UPI000E34434F|nr:GNAT family N-acetyltransferase [Emticicia sp. C21]RFS18083.1 GNAT family N-acetyltransferase [Emticicia sp. C21]
MIDLKQIQADETWALRHKVMWPDKPLDFVILPNDADGLHYGLFENGQLVSVISLFIKGDHAQFRKFATDTAYQGKGYGSQLLEFLIDTAKGLDIKELTCDARVTAIRFYKKFGMRTDSEIFQKSGKDYVRMSLRI